MNKLKLKNVTLFAIYHPFNDDVNLNLLDSTIDALLKSMNLVEFAEAKLISSKEIVDFELEKLLNYGIKCEVAKWKIKDIKDYSKYMIYDLYQHIDTDFVLIIQSDGYVINPTAWSDDFLNYDYIGAAWPIKEDAYISPFNEHIRVGNGGFSLRSKKLLRTPLDIDIPFDCTQGDFYKHFNQNNFNEDGCISVHNRHLYEANHCIFAPVDVAVRFSQELPVPESFGVTPFGFHKNLPIGFNYV